MTLSKKKLLKISKGQISEQLIERTDIGLLDDSGQEITNFYNSKYGALVSSSGTELKYTFGKNKLVKLQHITLLDSSDGIVAFNGTDKTIQIFNTQGESISNITSFSAINENNYHKISLVQNEDLILICTKETPLYKLDISDLPNLSVSIFAIPTEKILKSSNVSIPDANPIIFRMGNEGLPNNPTSYGIEIGDNVYPNSGTSNPNTTFPWNVKKLISLANDSIFRITKATINNEGTGYSTGDIVETDTGIQFEINDTTTGSELVILNPTQIYTQNPAGSNIAITGGSGTDMTINIESETLPNEWQDYQYTPNNLDVIKDIWNNKIWQYTNNRWIEPSDIGNDISLSYRVSTTAGTIKIIPFVGNFQGYHDFYVPEPYDVEKYARNVIIGTTFDGGNEGIGEAIITDISGSVNGRFYKITSLTAQTTISFLKADTTYLGGKVKLSEKKVFDGDYPNTNNNPTNTTNYPLNIFFYQQRLVIAGTTYNPQQMIFSKIGAYDDFTDDYYSTSAFQLIIGGTEKEEIRSIITNQGIQIFCKNSEWLMNDSVISRTSGFIKNSSIGTNGVQPIISANGITLFPPKNGKGLIGFVYNYDTASFHTPYISLFTNLLNEPIKDMYLKRGLDSQDDTLLFICDEKGNLIIGNYQSDHEIQAFCKRSSQNTKFLQSMQAENNVFFLTQRNNITSLEMINKNKYSTCSTNNYTYTASIGRLTVNIPQYEGQNINIYDNNKKFVGNYKIENGSVRIPDDKKPSSIGEIGFNIHSVFQSNPQNIGLETYAMYKNIPNIKVALTKDSKSDFLTINKKYGRNKDNFVSYYRVARPQRDCRFTIENDIYPCEILSIEVELEA